VATTTDSAALRWYNRSGRTLTFVMVELAAGADGVVGARMTGGGFGGCTVNLVRAARVEDFVRTIREGYREACGLNAEVYVCEASEGASKIS